MNSSSNRLRVADKLDNRLRSLRSELSEATEKKNYYVAFYAKIKENFNILYRKIEDTNIQLQTLTDNIDMASSRKRRSSRKKETYMQRVIDHAKKAENALIKKLKKCRQKALEMEKLMKEISKHLTEPKRIADEIHITQLKFQELNTRGRGKKTKNRKIKKNQTKTKRRKPTRRRKKPRKKKN